MTAAARRFVSGLLVAAAVLAASAQLADADDARAYDAYRRGRQALDRGAFKEAEGLFRAALAERAQEGNNIPETAFSNRVIPYLPNYYLGLSLYRQRRFAEAEEQWKKAQGSGVLRNRAEERALASLRQSPEFVAALGAVRGPQGTADSSKPPPPTGGIEPTVTTQPSSFTLNASKAGAGQGTITAEPRGINCGADCSESYASGTSVVLTAAPAGGSTFASWSGCDTVRGTQCTVTVSAARTATATFTALVTLTATRTGSGQGTITTEPAGITCGTDCTETYSPGASVTLTATPAPGSTLASWIGCDSVRGAQCTVAMTSARTATAAFAPVFVLTAAKDGKGQGTIAATGIACGADCTESYPGGTTVVMKATPASGSELVKWEGCDAIRGDRCTLTMNAARRAAATFAPATAPVSTGPIVADRGSSPSASVSTPPLLPDALRQGAVALFSGRYEDALRLLEPVGLEDRAIATQVHLCRAAARYALFLKGGEREPSLRASALEDVKRLQDLAPGFQPDPAVFSPRVREFVSRTP